MNILVVLSSTAEDYPDCCILNSRTNLPGKFCLSEMPAKLDKAPPSECPLETRPYPGCAANCVLTVEMTVFATEFHLCVGFSWSVYPNYTIDLTYAVRKPVCAVAPAKENA